MAGIYDDVSFYCPECKEKIYVLFRKVYVCGCQKKWTFSDPVTDRGLKPKVEINGREEV